MVEKRDFSTKTRVAALRRYGVPDATAEDGADEIAKLASAICDTPVALISLIDTDRQWLRARVGFEPESIPIEQSICAHAILEGGLVEIPDTALDQRTCNNPQACGPEGMRFYAGAPLITPDGIALGMLCVLDHQPRVLTALQRQALTTLAGHAMRDMELHRTMRSLESMHREVDHRVKNSLASVAAVVRLQTARATTQEVRDALGTMAARLDIQIGLHTELSQVGMHTEGDIHSFFNRLARPFRELLPEGVALDMNVDSAEMPFDRINAIGRVVNEFVTNSARHGYPDGRTGTVSITGRARDGCYTLTCCDDGCADQAVLDKVTAATGLGTRIIAASGAGIARTLSWKCMEPGLTMEITLETAPHAASSPA